MRRMVVATLAGTVLLSACGSSSAPQQRSVEIKVRGDEQRQLAAANEMDRSIALKRAIYDAGSMCKRVTGTNFVTDYKNMSMWQANCDDGKSWAVFIAPNGGVQVRPCADLKEFKLPECKIAEKNTAGIKPAG